MKSRITIPKFYAACFASSKICSANRIIQGLKSELGKIGFVPIVVINNFISSGTDCCAASKILRGGNISCSLIYLKCHILCYVLSASFPYPKRKRNACNNHILALFFQY